MEIKEKLTLEEPWIGPYAYDNYMDYELQTTTSRRM